MNAEMSGAPLRGIRGRLLSFLRAPSGAGDAASYRYIDDGLVPGGERFQLGLEVIANFGRVGEQVVFDGTRQPERRSRIIPAL